jgi:TonB family protein
MSISPPEGPNIRRNFHFAFITGFLLLPAMPLAASEGESTTSSDLTRCGTEYYPAAAKSLHQEGIVILRICVDIEGYPHPSLLSSSGFPLLDEAAQQTVRCARYKPVTKDGKPVEKCREVKVAYTLKGSTPPTGTPGPSKTTPEGPTSATPGAPEKTSPDAQNPNPSE